MPGRSVEGGVPALVEPAAAEGVDHRVEGGELLTPAGKAAEADTVGACALLDLDRGIRDLGPGRVVGHRHARLRQYVVAVHQHRGLAISGHGVKVAVVAEG